MPIRPLRGTDPQTRRFLALGIAVALGLCALAGCQPDKGRSGGEEADGRGRHPTENTTSKRRAVAVAVVPVERRDLAEYLELTGTLEARRQVAVSPRVGGRLAEVRVELGDRVAAGQAVARLDDTELRARVRQAEASEAAAKATFGQREADAAHQARQVRRDRDLLAKEYIARADVEDSEARLQAARTAVNVAKAELGRQQAALAEARTALGQAVLVAPMAGLVAQRHADPGAMVSASTPVITLVAPGGLKAVIHLPESAIAQVRPGTRATLQVDAWPEETFAAVIARLSPVVAPDTRQAQAELAVPDGAGRLRPGMLARVSLEIRKRRGVAAVPAEALVLRRDASGVFVKDGDRARFRAVTPGIRSGGWVEVGPELAHGTPVVTLGNHLLQDGSPVRTADIGKKRR